jgi:hypothetical protein
MCFRTAWPAERQLPPESLCWLSSDPDISYKQGRAVQTADMVGGTATDSKSDACIKIFVAPKADEGEDDAPAGAGVEATPQPIADLRRSSLSATPITAAVQAPAGDEGATPAAVVPAIVGAADTESAGAAATTPGDACGDAGDASVSTPLLVPVRTGAGATSTRHGAGPSTSATCSPAGTPSSTRRKRAL